MNKEFDQISFCFKKEVIGGLMATAEWLYNNELLIEVEIFVCEDGSYRFSYPTFTSGRLPLNDKEVLLKEKMITKQYELMLDVMTQHYIDAGVKR